MSLFFIHTVYHYNMFNMSFLFVFLFGCASLTLILYFFFFFSFFSCQFRSFLIQIYWIIITWIIWQMAFQTIALINSQCHQFHQVFNKATAITKRQNALINTKHKNTYKHTNCELIFDFKICYNYSLYSSTFIYHLYTKKPSNQQPFRYIFFFWYQNALL